MKKLFLTLVALMGATTLFAQTDMVATFQQAAANAKAANYTEAIPQLDEVINAYYDLDEPDANQEKAFAMAKKYIVLCYNKLGGQAYNAKNFDEAAGYFTEAANLAELYDNVGDMNKNRQFAGQCYEAKGAEAFNTGDYATAIEIFSKGYEADKFNTGMALNLAESFFRSDKYQEGMKVASEIAALNAEKFPEAVAEAQNKMDMYTNNQIAKLQQAKDYDGIIALADQLEDAGMAQKLILQAHYYKKEFDKMIAMESEAVAAQTTDAGRSDVYYWIGVAYNEKIETAVNAEIVKNQAVAAFRKVTAGQNVANAKEAVQALTAPAN